MVFVYITFHQRFEHGFIIHAEVSPPSDDLHNSILIIYSDEVERM